jgi:hypothetical protein
MPPDHELLGLRHGRRRPASLDGEPDEGAHRRHKTDKRQRDIDHAEWPSPR